MQVTLKVMRYDPNKAAKPGWVSYQVEAEPMDRVLDLLHKVKYFQDGTLAFRRSCGHGICGSDAMLINGKNQLACKALVKDLTKKAGDTITVEPLRGLPVKKDLVVDMDPFFDAYRAVKPYLINDEPPPDRERLQSPEDRARFDASTKCILCAACTTSCPVFWVNGSYIGPAAIVQAHRFIFDSRDRGARERFQALAASTGVWRCRTAYNCTEACPREIPVTQAIEEVKRAILYDKF
ncbi:Succinate dehydrogenase iron-sulfur subunit [Calidithermus terrae]|uniref:Succinate dehydrogenase iron-sulfur subunit n=1 Tax=Calidithermus terrae TaxID=1408545 RepID=A0A399EF08_9DEIN|nr:MULTISPECIES: succinate dehydrogenase iron-sulfur subunit [Calidithermus]RIH81739.1 Succinate dehydrogenase iron-sulfur subunit [Calidithermus terrae]